jgi:hypothetical protein
MRSLTLALLVPLAACGAGDAASPPSTGKIRVTASVTQSNVVGGSECTGSCCTVEWAGRIIPAGASVAYSVRAGGAAQYTGIFTSDTTHVWRVSRADYVPVSWHIQRDSMNRTEGWSMACGASPTGSTATWQEP